MFNSWQPFLLVIRKDKTLTFFQTPCLKVSESNTFSHLFNNFPGHKTWVWRPPGSILVTWGSMLVSFWRPWPPLRPSWATFGEAVEKQTLFPQKSHPIWLHFWVVFCQSWQTHVKNGIRKAVQNKSSLDLIRSGPMCHPSGTCHSFGEVQPCPLGWLLAPLWVPFGVIFGDFRHQWPILVLEVAP